jgi:myo-inositol-1(or 4)-monophosphatase
MNTNHPHLNIAIKAALKAGKLICRAFDRPDRLQIKAKGPHDLVTQIDNLAEETIIQTIHEANPRHCILAEESGEMIRDDKDVRWIIDPLDGTVNFAHGIPYFCVSIGVEFKGKMEHGVIYDPILQELFVASRGKGAKLNDKRIRVSDETKVENALIATHLPIIHPKALKRYLQTFGPFLEACGQVRQPGAAALMLAYVACGRFDAHFQADLKIWDLAAGTLMVQEAGGYVGDFDNRSHFLDKGEVVAGNRKIYTHIQKALETTI